MKKILVLLFISVIASGIYAQNPDGTAPKPIGPYSKAKMAQGFLFISGQIALDPVKNEMIKSDFRQEVTQVMNNLNSVLKENGMSFVQLVKCTVYLTDMLNYTVFNEVYAGFFPDNNFPAREVVQVVKLPKNARIEISAVAAP
jgi:2-iminobutanoate/2-iminopropanoate deaminase